jgi:hydrogenase maturation protease
VKILVLGMGNDLYGDDGVGIHAVRVLKKELAARRYRSGSRNEADFKECALSGIALLDVVGGYDALVIIDTIVKARPVTGRIRVLEASNVRDVPGPSPHYVSVPQILDIGRQLGLRVPGQLRVVAVEAKDIYHLGEGLSKKMTSALPRIVERAKKVLRDLEIRAGRERARPEAHRRSPLL